MSGDNEKVVFSFPSPSRMVWLSVTPRPGGGEEGDYPYILSQPVLPQRVLLYTVREVAVG